jgi:hypothetical protein
MNLSRAPSSAPISLDADAHCKGFWAVSMEGEVSP